MQANPYAAPDTRLPAAPYVWIPTAFIEGECLVVAKGAPLPHVCVQCGSRQPTHRRHQQFVWRATWTYVAALFACVFGLIGGAVVIAATQKTGVLQLPLCKSCSWQWKKRTLLAGVSVVLFLVGLFFGGVLAINQLLPGIALLAVTLAAAIAIYIFSRRGSIESTRVDDRSIWLRHVHPDAVTAIVQALPPR